MCLHWKSKLLCEAERRLVDRQIDFHFLFILYFLTNKQPFKQQDEVRSAGVF